MGSMETNGASTEQENLMREEQRDTIDPGLNKTFQSESAENEGWLGSWALEREKGHKDRQ